MVGYGGGYGDDGREKVQMAMIEAIKELKTDPVRYKELQEKIRAADTDEARASALVEFAINDERLQRLTPELAGLGTQAAATVTTVTVTTVIIIVPTAY